MHEGHRKRLKKRFIDEGLDSFEPHQILELILFYALPRKDTNEIAHKLINKFGSIAGVFEADVNDIATIPGLGYNSALLITIVPAISRIYFKDRWGARPQMDSSKKACEYTLSLFAGKKYEVFYLICLDSQNRLIHAALVHEGSINEAIVYPRIVVEMAIRHQAVNVILAHNHPGGRLEPSEADIDVTSKLAQILNAISIRVVDHIIVSGDKYFSFAEKGMV